MDFIVKNWALVALAAISGGMLLWPLLRKGAGGPWVSTLQATQLLNREDALLVDVRPAADFAAGHILGARNLPLAELDKRAGEIEREMLRGLDAATESTIRSWLVGCAKRFDKK